MVEWLYSYLFNAYPPIYIASWSIVLLLITILILLLVIFSSRIKKARKERKIKHYTAEYENKLTAFIFEEEEYEFDSLNYKQLNQDLSKIKKNAYRREAFITVLLRLHRDFKGDPAKRLEQLYKDLKMDLFAHQRIRFGSWYEKAFEFTELGQMQVENSLPLVSEYVDHYNLVLREEAQFAAIRMGGVENIRFLKDLKRPISHWQQTRIMQELDNFPLNQIPSFYYLLGGRNSTVIIFGLKLIAKYRQTDDPQQLMDLLRDPNEQVRSAALHALVEIEYFEAIDTIVELTKDQPEELWPQFIHAVGQLGDASHINFLETFLDYPGYSIVMEATKALIKLGYILPPDTPRSEFNKEIYKHARYELIP